MDGPIAELIDCIATGREPDAGELLDRARLIWVENGLDRSIFYWDKLAPESSERSTAIRMVLTALRGASAGT